MKRIMKYAAAAGVAGLFAIVLAVPSQAAPRHDMAPVNGYHATAATMRGDYHRAGYGYFGAPGYGAYDYAPGPATWGAQSEQACQQSPASLNYLPCLNQ